MNLTDFTIKDLFVDDAKLTFLVGAGSSVDAPSCLPAGRTMMESIIKYTCAESEIQKILKLKQLRFEGIVEIVRDRLDPELKIIDYYGQCDKPNLQHFFLAEMIKKGHFIMTTNFDFLIEYALLQSNIPKDEIIPVITKSDFEKFSNTNKLFEQGKKTIYKIHGSTKNVITGENTRDSLVATIQAFGSSKERLNVFQVEPFKRPLFDNITNGRSLIVMGYSGMDDFDIVPTLKVLKNLQNFVWINHIKDDGGKEKIYEIDINITNTLDKVNQILVYIQRMNNAIHVYRVDANTTRLIEKISDVEQKISLDNFSTSPMAWFKDNVKKPHDILKNQISYKIYFDFDIYEDAIRCGEKIIQIAEELGEKSWKSAYISNIGLIYEMQGKYAEALKMFEKALKIDEQLGNLSAKATRLNNIGSIYYKQGNYLEALKRHEKALEISEQSGNFSDKATFLNNIGLTYKMQGKYKEALKMFEEALQIAEQLGDLSGKAIRLSNIGLIYEVQGNILDAMKYYKQALQISEQLGDLSRKSAHLNNIGKIYKMQGKYVKALKMFNEALKINEQLGILPEKAIDLNEIGAIYYAQENYAKALKQFEEALKINEQLGNLPEKAKNLNNIGMIYKTHGTYAKALKQFEEALKINEQLGSLRAKATNLNNIGMIYKTQGNYTKALNIFEEALKIDEQLGDLVSKSIRLNNIGGIYNARGDYDKALKLYEEALNILKQLELSDSPDAKNFTKNIEYVKNKMK